MYRLGAELVQTCLDSREFANRHVLISYTQ